MKQKFKWLLALVAMVASVNLMAETVTISTSTVTNPALQNNNYGDYKDTPTETTIGGIKFSAQDISYNANGTPSGIAKKQFIIFKKTSGFIKNTETLALSSLEIICNNTNFVVSAGTESSSLETVSGTNTSVTIPLYTYANKTESTTPTDKSLTKITYNLTNKNFFKVQANSTGAAQIYSIVATYTTGPTKVTATLAANPTTAGSVSAEDGDENPVTSETELNPEDVIIVTATESNDDYYFYNWAKATDDDATIDDATAKETMVTMGSKNATITANFFPWANLSVSPTSKDLELPLASAEGSFEVTVTSDQEVTFTNEIDAIVTPTELVDNAAISAKIKEGSSSKGKTTTYVVEYMFDAAGSYTATIEFMGTDNQSKAANSATLTINATVKDLETLDAPEVTADKTAKSVTLTWDDVEHAQSYNVTFDGETFEGVTSPWEKTDLLAGTDHTYVVTAVGDGTTYLSNYTEGSVTTTAKRAIGIKDPVFVKE